MWAFNFAGNIRLKKEKMVSDSKRTAMACLAAVLLTVGVGALSLRGQSGDSTESKRKVKYLGRPQYPELARRLNLTGVVKVEVTIAPDGKVKRVHVLGGHPVLAAEAEKAAMESEFEPGPKETTEVIDFKFNP